MQASSSTAPATPACGSHDDLFTHHLRTLQNILELDLEPLNKLWLIQDIVHGWTYTLPKPGSVARSPLSRGQKRSLGSDNVPSPGGDLCSCAQLFWFEFKSESCEVGAKTAKGEGLEGQHGSRSKIGAKLIPNGL